MGERITCRTVGGHRGSHFGEQFPGLRRGAGGLWRHVNRRNFPASQVPRSRELLGKALGDVGGQVILVL